MSAAFSPKVIDMTRSKIGSTAKNRLEIQVALAAGLSMLRSADLTLAEIQARGREVAAGQKALRSPKTPVEASPASHNHPKKLAVGLWKLRARPAPHRNHLRPFAVCR